MITDDMVPCDGDAAVLEFAALVVPRQRERGWSFKVQCPNCRTVGPLELGAGRRWGCGCGAMFGIKQRKTREIPELRRGRRGKR